MVIFITEKKIDTKPRCSDYNWTMRGDCEQAAERIANSSAGLALIGRAYNFGKTEILDTHDKCSVPLSSFQRHKVAPKDFSKPWFKTISTTTFVKP